MVNKPVDKHAKRTKTSYLLFSVTNLSFDT